MVKPPTHRGTVLMAAGAAAIAVAGGSVAAQSTDIRGVVTFERGAAIPEGHIDIYLEDSAVRDDTGRRSAKTRVKSGGRSKAIAFYLSAPASSTASPKLQIVARLERADGWLVARGSVRVEAASPVYVTLNSAIY